MFGRSGGRIGSMAITDKRDAEQAVSTSPAPHTALLEEFPPSPAVKAFRRRLREQVDHAAARRDTAGLKKLDREIRTLAEIRRRPERRRQIDRLPHVAPASSETVIRHAAGPGRPGWGRRRVPSARRVGWSGPAREHAPLQYPHGDPPTGWETRRHETTINQPDSKSTLEQLARVRALERAWAEVAAAEAEAEESRNRCVGFPVKDTLKARLYAAMEARQIGAGRHAAGLPCGRSVLYIYSHSPSGPLA